jgi:hypothetical protein
MQSIFCELVVSAFAMQKFIEERLRREAAEETGLSVAWHRGTEWHWLPQKGRGRPII